MEGRKGGSLGRIERKTDIELEEWTERKREIRSTEGGGCKGEREEEGKNEG